ncbi:MAG TPA: AraC family transcriptional regulator [Puia sp.]|nr:AraC family transcriptional regulator [Puia sp.]
MKTSSVLPFFKTYSPSQLLSGLVLGIQVYRMQWGNEVNEPEPFITCLANTEQNLYFFVNDPMKIIPALHVEIPAPPIIVTGPKFKPVGLLFGQDHLMIKVMFHPTGTYRVLGIDMQRTVNTGLDAREFWGPEVNEILKTLRQTASYDEQVTIISTFLERKYAQSGKPEEPIDLVATKMLDPLQQHSLEEWSSEACLSLRQFERSFRQRVGISPKLFIRIVRFEAAMKVKNIFPLRSWSEIASECGYTDSSHLLKEFRELAEFPPSAFYLKQTSGNSQLPSG